MAWAVVDSKSVLIAGEQIPRNHSAQVAELIALTKVLEWGKGKRINVDTDSSNYTKQGIVCKLPGHNVVLTNLLESITIGHHEPTPYVEADDLAHTDDYQQIHRYIQKGLPRIPHLRADWEGLKEAKQIDHIWNKERELIKTHTEEAEELFKSQNFF
ncbi:hypothetical protein scyTo_0005761 [Scyliorhinus torazame]|uniref:RNase H type-1 domain-containing protein n=1 Tax=Scyliorhinus torazame TaxID=75743 RepID=A0A401PC93_SCYTO|nr:hypothetical protein [Scyliorhinus torazame]